MFLILEINNSYSVSDLTTQSDEITITSPPEINVVSIHMPVEEEETVEEDEMDIDSDDQSENVGDSAQQDEDSKEQEMLQIKYGCFCWFRESQ